MDAAHGRVNSYATKDAQAPSQDTVLDLVGKRLSDINSHLDAIFTRLDGAVFRAIGEAAPPRSERDRPHAVGHIGRLDPGLTDAENTLAQIDAALSKLETFV